MRKPVSLFLLLAAAPLAQAHTFGAEGAGFFAGLAHPLSGLDHLLAMLAVGLWSAWAAPKQVWAMPLAFMAAMAVGAALGFAGASMPYAEAGIGASVLVLGALLTFLVRLPVAAGALLVALFAVCHGHAHGGELPQAALPLAYAAGFLLTTGGLHVAGIFIGRALGEQRSLALRAIGATMGLTGVWLLAGA